MKNLALVVASALLLTACSTNSGSANNDTNSAPTSTTTSMHSSSDATTTDAPTPLDAETTKASPSRSNGDSTQGALEGPPAPDSIPDTPVKPPRTLNFDGMDDVIRRMTFRSVQGASTFAEYYGLALIQSAEEGDISYIADIASGECVNCLNDLSWVDSVSKHPQIELTHVAYVPASQLYTLTKKKDEYLVDGQFAQLVLNYDPETKQVSASLGETLHGNAVVRVVDDRWQMVSYGHYADE